jgi:hypothetical protein
MDFARRRLVFSDASGEREAPLPEEVAARLASDFDAVAIDIPADEVTMHWAGGQRSTVAEIGLGDPADLGGRLVVYLDQNHWSTIAAVQHGWYPVEPAIAQAAERLLELADQRRIVLPLSAGHAIETSQQYADRRVQLATTILHGSRGWQMLHPVRVRAGELACAFGDNTGATERETFTRAADVVWTRRLRPGPRLPIAPLDRLLPRITDLASFAAVLRDPAQMEDTRSAAERWVAQWRRISRLLDTENADAARTREVAFGAVLADLAEELLEHAPVERLTRWFDDSARRDVNAMPFVSRLAWVTYARLRNRGGSWHANDYIDLNFLCCAAGYADVVIGERRTIADLRTARNSPQGGRLATDLREGVKLVTGLLEARSSGA